MAPSIFAEKDLARILSDVNGYGHIFLDHIHAWDWYELVYDNSDHEAYYCPELVKLFYNPIDQASITFDTYQILVHMPTGDIVIALPVLEEFTHVSCNPHHSDPLPLIDYMTVMGARCTEQDRGLKASTTFRNIHCVGRWIQRNILGLDHTTSFNRPVLQIIHDLMTRQHTTCINKTIFHKYHHQLLTHARCKVLAPSFDHSSVKDFLTRCSF